MLKIFPLFLLLLLPSWSLTAQEVESKPLQVIDYNMEPREYEIGGITVSGVQYISQNVLVQFTGLEVGKRIMIPGEEIRQAIEKLWDQNLFSDVRITYTRIEGDVIFLDIFLQEMPRLSRFSFSGITKTEAEDLRDKVKLVRGNLVTPYTLQTAQNAVQNHFINKGYLYTDVIIHQRPDTALQNSTILDILVDKKSKVKIREIQFEGATVFPENKLRRAMKDTKQKTWYNIFKASKYIEDNFIEDQDNIIAKYNELGYRDARIVRDSLYHNDDGTVGLIVGIDEGQQYFFRNISWAGNTKYSSELLSMALNIKKGDVYDLNILDNRLRNDPDAVGALYMDNGYLFYSANPVEVGVENDSVDIQIVIAEGPQARINNVIITGNDRTNEHVIRREIRTKPGDLFSRSAVIRSVRELAQLGFFDPEQIEPIPIPNEMDGTVDIEYKVVERANDQIEISGGWGANMVIGTLGVRFGNFSAKNFFNKKAWRPLPSGDGQNLSIRAQSNGRYYQAYSASFVEPWLGGKKPNSLSVSLYHTVQTNGYQSIDPSFQSMRISGASIGLGRRLSWPDDWFTLYNQLSFQQYRLDNWSYFLITDGISNNLSFTTTLGRNSTDQIIYPRMGSNFSLSLQITPPFSSFNGKDYKELDNAERYKWIEYHKWSFKSSWYTKLWGIGGGESGEVRDFVLATKAEFGYLGFYNRYARSPFESFEVGGDGMMGYSYYGKDLIALRGYANGSLTPEAGANLYTKFTMEMRFPISLNPNAMLYALAFLEAGNAWYDFTDFNPFNMKRSAGFGVRIYLPMFGLMGVDWGYGFDDFPGSTGKNRSQFHFVLGPQM
ncbi:MAG: outer membrane protein assembly factor BamA [Bacteroidales bacterium]|jgi:outer membrane protein insertion porin family|nr:outer membrane protein assembly factor BamA [Bacteroidales bacterium]MDD2570905.1 outer membrane protein assembly factor BamA [Bacteroidales bacterium]MDD2812449.1 outer membrane protein assembly factor BamA [Bacteroidales bacterium]MDD3385299.1 outer membrane protein assembly factor BamA [Bacteroidales bacterium]MDD3811070.1 outer membrane protein assembly factor BamA [Bacteroidales bacterium]